MNTHQSRRSRQLPLALLISGLAFIVTLVPAAMYGLPASAASAGSTLSQCTNGAAGPPVVLEQCAGSGNGTASILNGAVSPSGYANWVNGNANGSKAHWREGEFIPYRLAITGNTPGTYTAQLQYDTVHSGGHAIDYLGSYDASETTSTACPQTNAHTFGPGCPVNPFHANYSNPCADLGMPAADCNNTTVNPAPAPTTRSTASVPGTCSASESNTNCTSPDNLTAISQGATCGTSGSTGAVAHGTFSQVGGTFDLFGPSGSTINSVTYVGQNVLSGSNTCTTTLNVKFTIGGTSGTPTAVLAWGGHIASSVDWGSGNSASSISGSPYHMVLAACDCGGGKQDRALATSAVVFNTSTATQLSASSISVGGTASDTATVTGASSGAAGTVTFTVYTNNTCTAAASTGSGGQINAQPGTVPIQSNNAGTLTFVSPAVTFQAAGTYYWQAVYSGDTSAANTQPSTSPCTATNNEQLVVASPSLTLTKTADASPVLAGNQIGFTVTLTNSGQGSANGIVLSDSLPSGSGLNWSLDTVNSTIPTGISCTVTPLPSPQSLTCGATPSTNSAFSLASGATLKLHVISQTSAATCSTTAYTNTASFTSSNAGRGSQQASVTVTCPNLSGTKTADAATVNAGGTIGFTVTLSNSGTGAATNEALTDNLPAGYTWTLLAGSGSGTSIPSGITCDVHATSPQVLSCGASPSDTGTFTLAANTTITLHVTAPVPTGSACTPGTVTNTASFGGSTSNTGGQANVTVTVTVTCPNVTGTKTADASPVNAGGTIGFVVSLSNTGTGAATNEALTDNLPAGYTWTLLAGSGSGTSIPSGITCDVHATSPQVLSCGTSPSDTGMFTLAANTTITLHVTATVPTGSACVPGPVTNTASFGGSTSNSGGQPNATATVTVTCPNVTGTKTADASTVNAGGTIGFTVTLSNTGTGAATNEALTDNLPTGYTWTLLTGSGSGTSIPSGITCDVHGTSPQVLSCGTSPSDTGTFTLPANTTITLHVTAPVPTGSACVPGPVTNTASFGGSNSNTGGQPNASATVTVTCPNVTGTKTADASTVNAGGTIGFVVTLSNSGTGAATNEALTDNLPAGYTWTLLTGSGSGTSIPSGITCDVHGTSPQVLSCGTSPSDTGTFTLAANTTITLHVTAPVPTGSACVPGPVTNTASFGGSTSNTGGQPNAMATVTVTCPHVTGNKTPDANGGTVNAGTTIGFIVTLSNTGTGAATNETLSDTLPAGGLIWTLQTGTGSGTSIPAGISCGVSSTSPQVLSCGTSPNTTGTFTLAANTTITLHITSPTSGSTCGTFTNIASFGSSTSNAGSGSTPPASITVNCAILHVTKTTCPATTVVPGGILTYSITFSNSGAGPANNAVLTDTLPAGVQVTNSGGGTVNGNTITWNLGTIAPGGSGSETVLVLVTAANGATLVNTVSLTSTTAAVTATDQTTTAVSNAGAITHGEANWLNATALGLPLLDAGQVNTMATPSSPQAVAGSQLGPLSLLGIVSATLVSDQSNSSVTDQATSTATTTIATLNLLDGAITADSIEGVSQSVATPTTASFNSTGSNFVNLSYLGANGQRINLANVAPNTSVTVYNPLLPTQKLATVVLYEQSGTSGLANNLWSASHSVNMIDVTLLQPFLTLPAGAVIIVGHAQSDATYPSGLACGTTPNTVSGEAFSALNNDTLLSNPLLGVLVGDAKLPPTGGSNSNQLAGVTLPDVVLNGTLVNSTSGSTTPTPNATSSSTTQSINILGGLVTADAIDVSSTSQATGTSASTTYGSVCTANTCPTGCSTSAPCFVNLAVNGTTLVGINGGTIKPNTTIAIPQSTGGLILVILNEQITSGDGAKNTSGTVNAIHVYVLNGSGLLTAEVIVASAHSDAHHS